ncbi:MAG: M56 family metallopeptidase [Armatimonadetes bacterium]|nr:M56 family metallopeptidase [Armatimonadota bacterium]
MHLLDDVRRVWRGGAAWHALGRSLGYLVGVFLARHWVLAVANAALTALLGLGALRLVRRLSLGPSIEDWHLRLRHFVLLAALCKGAFYLILGDNHRFRSGRPVGFGLQLPSPFDLLHLAPRASYSVYSVWRPTMATELVGPLLAGADLVLLLRRGLQLAALLSWLGSLPCVRPGAAGVPPTGRDWPRPAPEPAEGLRPAQGPLGERVEEALRRAAAALGLAAPRGLPRLVLAELPAPTPLLLGLWRPYLLLAPSFAATLSDAEMEMALRHELAHLRRHDHWWRWLLLWVEDLGRLNPLTSWLSREAMEQEEAFCDRQAVSSARDAADLAQAIVKCRRHLRGLRAQWAAPRRAGPVPAAAPPLPDALALPDAVLPMLLGQEWGHQDPDAVLRRRLARLLAQAQGAPPARASALHTLPRAALRRGLHWGAFLLLAMLLALIAYAKFFLVINFS